MKEKKLIVATGQPGSTDVCLASIKERYGDSVIIITPEEALKEGVNATYTITAPPVLPVLTYSSLGIFKDGKQNRRERRAANRKLNKK